MSRPRIFFDTNVLEPLSKPPLQSGLEKMRRHSSQKYVYVVSPLTVDELLLGIEGGDGIHFQRDQAKMNVLRGVGAVRMLPPPATFALQYTLALKVNPPTPSGDDVKKCIEAVLKAKSKAQLEQGLVRLPLSRKTGGLNFDPIKQRIGAGKAEHARVLEQLRAKQLRRPTPEEWVKKSFRHFHLRLEACDWRRLAMALEAAFAMNALFCDQAERPKYDFAAHSSDWIDVHQLFYLSDPNAHFLTGDGKLRNRVSHCGQAAQIITLDDVLKSLGLQP